MRNSFQKIIQLSSGALLALALAGCAPTGGMAGKAELSDGYAALENRQYDQALARADSFLQRTPTGTGSAEALYLRGRALEQKTAASQAEARSNLQGARDAYAKALLLSPPQKLEGNIHAGLANVAYFQEDYNTAATEWTMAYDKLDDTDTKAWVLYRIGICRQRLNQFTEADRFFGAVQQRYPSTEAADRARDHQGARGFMVQFATYSNAQAADEAISAFRRDGVTATRKNDARGRAVVMAGPVPTYQQAQQLRGKYTGKYPDALILP